MIQLVVVAVAVWGGVGVLLCVLISRLARRRDLLRKVDEFCAEVEEFCTEDGCHDPATHETPYGVTPDGHLLVFLVCRRHGVVPRAVGRKGTP